MTPHRQLRPLPPVLQAASQSPLQPAPRPARCSTRSPLRPAVLAGRLLPAVLAMLLLATAWQHAVAAEPPTRPFPRIEAGQHTAMINRIGVDAAGRWLVTASDDKTARVWELATGRLVRVLRPPIGENHEGKLFAAALSPDGRTVAVGGWTGYGWERRHSIYLFDRDTGTLAHRIGGLPNVINHLAFSPDGRRLAAALGAGGIRVFDTDGWAEVERDADYGARSYWVSFDAAGRLASTCDDGQVRLYDPDLGLIAKAKAPGGERPFALAFSPDGARIAVGFDDSTAVNVLSAEDLSLLHAPDTSGVDNGDLSKVAWSRDGRTLFAGGRYNMQGDENGLVSWPDAGRGPPRERPVAKSTIMDLAPLADGRLAFGAADPAWGLLDAGGELIRGRGPAIADFRRRSHQLRLSADGMTAELDLKVLAPDHRWREHVLRLDLTERRLTLDPGDETETLQRRLRARGHDPGPIDGALGRRTRAALEAFQRDRELAATGRLDDPTRAALGLPRLAGPRTEGLAITDWLSEYDPRLDGELLDLERFEMSRRLDIADDDRRFLLGTAWYLRLYDRDGDLLWKTPAPATTWMVNLSADGRWAVAAFGDGSVRWLDADSGEERLALFVDGAAVAALDGNKSDRGDRGGDAASTGEAPAGAVPWVLWTPEGFFDSAGGGDRLMGWHLNRGADRAGELVDAEQIGEVFRRPDLIAKALTPEYPALARTALADIGDLDTLLAAKPPLLAPLGPVQVRQSGRDFEARFRVQDRGSGVGRIEYRVNGVLIGQGDLRGRFGLGLPNQREESRPFTLDAGTHRVEARVFDGRDRVASNWAAWDVEVTGRDRRRPALYGLAVGIGPYKNPTWSLEYGDDDAEAFASAVNAAARGLFRAVEIETVVNDEATLDGITHAFEAMAAKAGPDDVFVLFLAGHGLAQEGRYHFIPWDFSYTSSTSLADGSLHEDRLQGLLAQVQARKSLVVLDSCYAGAVADTDEIRLAGLARSNADLETRAAIDRLMAKTGRAILAGTSDKAYALEGLEGHGLFTYVLLEGLAGRADLFGDRDGTIETGELAEYLADEVPRMSRRVWQYAMEPWNDLRGQSFPIGLRGRAEPAR